MVDNTGRVKVNDLLLREHQAQIVKGIHDILDERHEHWLRTLVRKILGI